MPTVQGVIDLADATNGLLLGADGDSIEITDRTRTGAATMLAALAPRPAGRALRHDSRRRKCRAASKPKRSRPAAKLDTMHVRDIKPDAAKTLARELTEDLKIDVRPSADLAAVRDSDIVVTCDLGRGRGVS